MAMQQCNKVILDHFWTLADPQESRRCRSAQVILQTLSNQVGKKQEKNDIQYCFDRVIKGLTSTRAFARHGYCVLFSALVSEFHTHCDLNELFEVARKEFGARITSDTASENTIAWALFLASLSKSGQLHNCDKALLNEVFSLCLVLGSKKDFVEIIASDIVKDLVGKVTQQDLEGSYLEVFKSVDDSKKSSLFYIYSLLLINERFPELGDDFVRSFITSNVYKKNSPKFEKAIGLLKESTKSYPNIHPIVKAIIETIFAMDSSNFGAFSTAVIDKLINANFEKVLLAFEIVKILLNFATEDQISKLLSPAFMEVFIKALAWKDNPNHQKAIVLGEYIQEYSGRIRDKPRLQIELAKCLVEKPGGVHFDELSKSKILQTILKNFGDDAIGPWILYVQNILLNETEVPQSDFTRVRALQQMIIVVKQYRSMTAPLTEVLLFLFCHSFVDFSAGLKLKKVKVQPFKVAPSAKLEAQIKEGFFSVLSHACQVATEKTDAKQVKLQKQNAVLENILEDILAIFADKKVTFKADFRREAVAGTLEKIRQAVEKINGLKEKTVQNDTFKYLYLNFAFESLSNPEEIDGLLGDLEECLTRCLVKKPKKATRKAKGQPEGEGEPQWADVITDLFLSLLSKNSKHMKSVILTSYRQIAPFVTEAGIETISNAALGKAIEDSDDEDDDDEDDDEEKMDVDKENDDQDDDDDDDDEESDDDDDDDMEVDPEFKKKLKEALGDAIDDDDDEEEEEEVKGQDDDEDDDEAMDDEAMFRIDDALAEVFRNKFGDKKKAHLEKEQMLNFRSRALELFQQIVEHKDDLSLASVLTHLISLLSLTRQTYSVKEMSVLSNKCLTIFESIQKRKTFQKPEAVEQEAFREVCQALIDFQAKCSDHEMAQKLVNLTVWLFASMKENIKDFEPIDESLGKALQDYCSQKGSIEKNLFVRLTPTVLELEKKPFQKSAFYRILVENAFKQNTRAFLRGATIELMALILNNLKNNAKDSSCYIDLAKATIKQLAEDFKGCSKESQEESTKEEESKKKDSKLSAQYLNSAVKLLISTNILDSSHADKLKVLGPELTVLLPKFEALPKETRRALEKSSIARIKNAIEKK